MPPTTKQEKRKNSLKNAPNREAAFTQQPQLQPHLRRRTTPKEDKEERRICSAHAGNNQDPTGHMMCMTMMSCCWGSSHTDKMNGQGTHNGVFSYFFNVVCRNWNGRDSRFFHSALSSDIGSIDNAQEGGREWGRSSVSLLRKGRRFLP